MTAKQIKLKSPFKTQDGVELAEIRLREPKVKDQLVATKSSSEPAEQEITLISNLAGLAPSDIHEMSASDYLKVQAALQDFFTSE